MKSRNKNKELGETKEENNLWSVPGTSHGDNSTTFITTGMLLTGLQKNLFYGNFLERGLLSINYLGPLHF